jgi:hypothetical protein
MSYQIGTSIVIDDDKNIINIENVSVSGIITSTNFVGNLTGTASTATASATAYGLTGTISGSGLTNLNASNLGSGTVPDARFPATLPTASGANLTTLNASNLSSGTVGTARLASGTANSGTYLRGDQTWAAISAGYDVTTTSINKTLSSNELTVALTSGLTITLPSSPSTGARVAVSVGAFTNTIVARNGSNIMGLAEDLTIDIENRTINFYYVDATRGWRIY